MGVARRAQRSTLSSCTGLTNYLTGVSGRQASVYNLGHLMPASWGTWDALGLRTMLQSTSRPRVVASQQPWGIETVLGA